MDDADHVLAHLELGHIYCHQAEYPQALYHYEYAAHRGGGGVIHPKVPKFAPGDVYDEDDARLRLGNLYLLGRVPAPRGIIICIMRDTTLLACHMMATNSIDTGLSLDEVWLWPLIMLTWRAFLL